MSVTLYKLIYKYSDELKKYLSDERFKDKKKIDDFKSINFDIKTTQNMKKNINHFFDMIKVAIDVLPDYMNDYIYDALYSSYYNFDFETVLKSILFSTAIKEESSMSNGLLFSKFIFKILPYPFKIK